LDTYGSVNNVVQNLVIKTYDTDQVPFLIKLID
jgi:hypothetical protein